VSSYHLEKREITRRGPPEVRADLFVFRLPKAKPGEPVTKGSKRKYSKISATKKEAE
jgi:hypothetical protein